MAAIHPDEFRRLCGHFASGVTIITTTDADGAPAGMTATSFASLSLEPPLITVAVDLTATILPAMRTATRFTVNILASTQETLSRRFAASLPERFDGVGWTRTADGHIVLDGVLASITCDVVRPLDIGDHVLFIGQVTGGESRHAHPLLHYRGGYADLDPM